MAAHSTAANAREGLIALARLRRRLTFAQLTSRAQPRRSHKRAVEKDKEWQRTQQRLMRQKG